MVSLFKQSLFMKQRGKVGGNEILGCSPTIMQLCEGGPYDDDLKDWASPRQSLE